MTLNCLLCRLHSPMTLPCLLPLYLLRKKINSSLTLYPSQLVPRLSHCLLQVHTEEVGCRKAVCYVALFNNSPLGLSAPPTPTTPSSPSAPDGKHKRANPLTDLVETEKIFVDQLTGIIRKVAAAWSRSNLPPPELDSMFRSIEGIYKANRGLHAKLKDINADPKSAGELGGLLIKWIDDLKRPYETYCTKYCFGFDTWQPVQSNARLEPILVQFSSTNQAPSNAGIWTLDSLFLLPKTRLKYYLKLYNRLLKNTDNRLLVGAVDTLNDLLDTLEGRSMIKVGDQQSETSPLETEDEVVIDMQNLALNPPTPAANLLRSIESDAKTGSETSSNHGSVSGGWVDLNLRRCNRLILISS
ncbi:Dbl homology domain-containing protein [Flammula alnicola]|nr:Dbl homology domain-containing protein [Flammula alnicola]